METGKSNLKIEEEEKVAYLDILYFIQSNIENIVCNRDTSKEEEVKDLIYEGMHILLYHIYTFYKKDLDLIYKIFIDLPREYSNLHEANIEDILNNE